MGNWDGGQVSTLSSGGTLTCQTLNAGQLYGIFFYNSAQQDNDATVTLVWSNAQPPVPITVPGTTANQGLASVALVSGNDTQTVSVSIVNQPNAQVTAWICSVRMPTDTIGIHNQPLPFNGVPQQFADYDRYYAVPPSSWQEVTINSSITQFISLMFQENYATVNIVNPTSNPTQNVYPVGSVAKSPSTFYTVNLATNPPQSLSFTFQGNGGAQYVWMNADSPQDSQGATITAQSLSAALALRQPKAPGRSKQASASA